MGLMGTRGHNKGNYSWLDGWTDGRTEETEGRRQGGRTEEMKEGRMGGRRESRNEGYNRARLLSRSVRYNFRH